MPRCPRILQEIGEIAVTSCVKFDLLRFRDVVPYDENRVKITNDKENKLGYVNAR